ncbi:hypothetical protein, partial [Mobiluncus sp.]|uniref:hypothetical protein n=1 Tax=Mobiluncus sp. TaxID=47293 RepID=UPI002A90F9E5
PEKPDKHGPHQIRKPQKHKQKHPKKGTKKRVNKKQNAIEIKTNKPTHRSIPVFTEISTIGALLTAKVRNR